jgi:adenylate cyclase
MQDEFEKTYLAKYLPEDVKKFSSREIIDVYIPESKKHPCVRFRKSGDGYEITKKRPVDDGDCSHQIEETIKLDEEEFRFLENISSKKIRKERFYYRKDGVEFEIDVFKDRLEGLVLIDVEFKDSEERDDFDKIPDFCLAEVTQEEFVAGGMLAGEKYGDIKENLVKYGYEKLSLE